jgi:uracil phosphoribosyltransferase
MMVLDFSESNSILNVFVSELRDIRIQKDALRFRRNLERIGEVMAYEISKKLDYDRVTVETPLGLADANMINDNVVVATILRAGLPMHTGFLNFFDQAENAFVSAYRKYKDQTSFDVHVEYISCPSLAGKTLILVDPMLATGTSFELAYRALLTKGAPAETFMVCAIASQQGVDNLRNNPVFRNASIWCGAIDPELNHKSYIIPGLGDAGDLAYGIKD